jgi:dihydropteroate synthase
MSHDLAPASTRIGPTTFVWGSRTFVMGILNVTPDSFSGDGLLDSTAPTDPVERALRQARRMVDEGADLLDIGGESTRPGHEPLDAAAERARVLPVIRAVRAALPGIPISVDTTKADVADAAIAAGADLLNDIWGVGPAAGALAAVAADRHVPLVVMHNRDAPDYADLVGEIVADLRTAVDRAITLGVPEGDLIVDPGIGFGKTAEQNVVVLRELAELHRLGRPVLLGTSRKSTIGRILDLPPDQRLEGTLATTALGIAAGADIVRVHDVQANVRTARVADAIIRGTWPADPTEGGPR